MGLTIPRHSFFPSPDLDLWKIQSAVRRLFCWLRHGDANDESCLPRHRQVVDRGELPRASSPCRRSHRRCPVRQDVVNHQRPPTVHDGQLRRGAQALALARLRRIPHAEVVGCSCLLFSPCPSRVSFSAPPTQDKPPGPSSSSTKLLRYALPSLSLAPSPPLLGRRGLQLQLMLPCVFLVLLAAGK
jgi:hypothetical protein